MKSRSSKTENGVSVQRCKSGFLQAELKAYLDGELSGLRHKLVSSHVSRCSACSEELAWLQRLGKNMRGLEQAYPRPEIRSRILATLPPMEVSPKPVTPARRPSLRLSPAYGLACAVLIAVTGVMAARSYINRPQPTAALRGTESGSKAIAVAPGTTETAPAPGGSSISAQELASLSQPDPTSIAADAAARNYVAQEKKRNEKTVAQHWTAALATLSRLSAEGTTGGYIQAVLETDSLSRSISGLQAWAKKHGATAVVGGNTSSHADQAQVVLQTPSSTAVSVLAALRKAGSISSVAPVSGATPGSAQLTAPNHEAAPTVSARQNAIGEDGGAIPAKGPAGTAKTSTTVVIQLLKSAK